MRKVWRIRQAFCIYSCQPKNKGGVANMIGTRSVGGIGIGFPEAERVPFILPFPCVAVLMFAIMALRVAAVDSTATVECGQLVYPPNVLERGFRRDFKEETYGVDGTVTQLQRAGDRGFGLVNAMIPLYEDRTVNSSDAVGSPLSEFYSTNGAVASRVDANLTTLRGVAKDNRMLILHQMMGTPTNSETVLFTNDPDYVWNGGANDYAPLPVTNQWDECAAALSDYFRTIVHCDGRADAGTPDDAYVDPDPGNLGYPTIWIGSQEPEHTLGYTDDSIPPDGIGDASRAKSLENNRRYIRFWSRVAKRMQQQQPDVRIGGIQQNGMEGVTDRYVIAANYWMEWEAGQGETYPIDYFTIQNYKTPADMPTIMANFRKALTTSDDIGARSHQQVRDRFRKTPVLFDRWRHYLDGVRATEKDTAPGLVRFLSGERIIVDQPDVYGYCAEANGFEDEDGWMTADVGAFLVRMPPERRSISFSSPDLDGIAAVNALGAYVVVWNASGTTAHNLALDLNNLVPEGAWADAGHLTVKRGSGSDYPDGMAAPVLTGLGGDDYRITGITLPTNSFVTIRWDADDAISHPYADELDLNLLAGLRYTAHNIYCDRQANSSGIPRGMGQYSQRTAILTAAVNDGVGVGLAGAVFRQVPVSRTLNMFFSSENLPLFGDGATKLQMRIDYLEGTNVSKTVLLRPSNFANADAGYWGGLDWNPIGTVVDTAAQGFGTDGQLRWDIGASAPATWILTADNDRGLMVSLLLADAPTASAGQPEMVRVRLGDEEASHAAIRSVDMWKFIPLQTPGDPLSLAVSSLNGQAVSYDGFSLSSKINGAPGGEIAVAGNLNWWEGMGVGGTGSIGFARSINNDGTTSESIDFHISPAAAGGAYAGLSAFQLIGGQSTLVVSGFAEDPQAAVPEGTLSYGAGILTWTQTAGHSSPVEITFTNRNATQAGTTLTFSNGLVTTAGNKYGLYSFTYAALPPESSGYAAWAAGWGVDLGASNSDYDHDGQLNLYEYGLGGDPTNSANQGTSPVFGSLNVGGTNWFGYIHPQLAADQNSGLTYYLELNTDLVAGAWTNAGYRIYGTNVTGGDLDFVTNLTTTVDSKKFIRLKIE